MFCTTRTTEAIWSFFFFLVNEIPGVVLVIYVIYIDHNFFIFVRNATRAAASCPLTVFSSRARVATFAYHPSVIVGLREQCACFVRLRCVFLLCVLCF